MAPGRLDLPRGKLVLCRAGAISAILCAVLHRSIRWPMPSSHAVRQDSGPPVQGGAEGAHSTASLWALMLGSIGVVYGDIGTSPLYALREAVAAAVGPGGSATREAVLGVLSLILWALIIVVSLKYVLVLLRADNNGEGGTLTLMALAQRATGRSGATVVLLGVIGAALFFGDAMITPAISVLSAVEGLKIATPALDPYVVLLTVVILVALFAVQSRGTARVAALFGPVMVVWFLTLAVAGFTHLFDDPRVFAAFNPLYAVHFMLDHGVI